MISRQFTFVSYFREEESSDIIFAEFPKGIKVDLQVAQELVANRLDFTQDKKHYYILDLSNVKDVTTEAKDYMQNAEAGLKNILGGALIATNPISRLIASIFVKSRMNFPARVFSNKEEAFEWIAQQKKKAIR